MAARRGIKSPNGLEQGFPTPALVLVSGLLGTQLHSRRRAAGKQAKFHLPLSLALASEPSSPLPHPDGGETVFHETGAWCQKGRGPLNQRHPCLQHYPCPSPLPASHPECAFSQVPECFSSTTAGPFVFSQEEQSAGGVFPRCTRKRRSAFLKRPHSG